MSHSNKSTVETVAVNAKTYLSLPGRPKRVKQRLNITVASRAYLPHPDDLATDWVAHVAAPAFKLYRSRRKTDLESFASIGTGSGLDILAGIETLGATRVGLTDVHDEVVAAAALNVSANVKPAHPLVIEDGFGDLLTPLAPFSAKYDLIYENLPNVPASPKSIRVGRKSGTHLAPRAEDIPAFVRQQMLDLHYLALRQARTFLKPRGAVLSALGGRIPLENFLKLAELAGYRGSFLTFSWKVQAEHHDVVRDHAKKQKEGFGPFHFYRADILEEVFSGVTLATSGRNALKIEEALRPHRLDAPAAYAALKKGLTIGHTVAVLKSERR